MKQLDIEEIKKLQVSILKVIDSFCIANNIKYSIAYGTLIGALRHKGYIPWDDDIDVIMMRSDYELFLKEFNYFDSRYAVVSTESHPHFYAPYANVFMTNTILEEDNNHWVTMGIKIDIFPIDHVPDNKYCRKFLFSLATGLKYLIGFRNEKSYRGKGIAHIICAKISKLLLGNTNPSLCLSNLAKWTNERFKKTSSINNIVWCAAGEKGTFKMSDFSDVERMQFEDSMYNVLNGYHNFLFCHYGNYMELPPVEKRISNHTFKAWIKD